MRAFTQQNIEDYSNGFTNMNWIRLDKIGWYDNSEQDVQFFGKPHILQGKSTLHHMNLYNGPTMTDQIRVQTTE